MPTLSIDKAFHRGGIDIHAYVYLYWGLSPWGQTPVDRVNACLKMLEGYDVKYVWLDCEDTTHPFDADQLSRCINASTAANLQTGIYTGRWWWPRAGNFLLAWPNVPLWDALYTSEGDPPDIRKEPQSFDRWKPYGGWTQPLIWQWHNTTTFGGHSVDLNVMEEEDELSAEEKAELLALRKQVAEQKIELSFLAGRDALMASVLPVEQGGTGRNYVTIPDPADPNYVGIHRVDGTSPAVVVKVGP